MELLLTQALPTTERVRAEHGANIGRLLTPRHYPSAAETVAAGITWAADNDGWGGVDADAFRRMLVTLAPHASHCRFVTVPDVVADGAATIASWRMWADEVRGHGFPPALVLQDGMQLVADGIAADGELVPWTEIGAVFVGGSTEWKLGTDAAAVAREAHRRGLWVHVGRVNSVRRLQHAAAIDADSCDGTGWVRFKRSMLPLFSRWDQAGQPAQLVAA